MVKKKGMKNPRRNSVAPEQDVAITRFFFFFFLYLLLLLAGRKKEYLLLYTVQKKKEGRKYLKADWRHGAQTSLKAKDALVYVCLCLYIIYTHTHTHKTIRKKRKKYGAKDFFSTLFIL